MASDQLAPPVESLSPAAWLRKNLFSTWYDALVTVVLGAVLGLALTAHRDLDRDRGALGCCHVQLPPVPDRNLPDRRRVARLAEPDDAVRARRRFSRRLWGRSDPDAGGVACGGAGPPRRSRIRVGHGPGGCRGAPRERGGGLGRRS